MLLFFRLFSDSKTSGFLVPWTFRSPLLYIVLFADLCIALTLSWLNLCLFSSSQNLDIFVSWAVWGHFPRASTAELDRLSFSQPTVRVFIWRPVQLVEHIFELTRVRAVLKNLWVESLQSSIRIPEVTQEAELSLLDWLWLYFRFRW